MTSSIGTNNCNIETLYKSYRAKLNELKRNAIGNADALDRIRQVFSANLSILKTAVEHIEVAKDNVQNAVDAASAAVDAAVIAAANPTDAAAAAASDVADAVAAAAVIAAEEANPIDFHVFPTDFSLDDWEQDIQRNIKIIKELINPPATTPSLWDWLAKIFSCLFCFCCRKDDALPN